MDWFLIADSSWVPWWLAPSFLFTIFKMAVGLGFVIFVHELGHFAVAKMCGVKCEKFYIGFDFFDLKIGRWTILPRALFKYKYGETEYGIGIIPLGGYVKMLGQDDNPANREAENERSLANKDGDAPATGKVVHDPRSYLAKSVPQRMAIISAGVIMNLIFAVIFATIAHKVGVPYRPCLVGNVSPGGAAWRAGLRPGDKILRINDSRTSEHLRWDWDMMNATITAGVGAKMELLVRTSRGTDETIVLHTRASTSPGDTRPVLGIIPKITTRLREGMPVIKHTPASDATEAFKGNDVVVAMRPKSHAAATPVKSYEEAATVFNQFLDEPLFVTVERSDPKVKGDPAKIEIEVGASPCRTLGLIMRRGAISGVRPGSPAAAAGLKEGDIIRRFADQSFGDPLTFHFRLIPFYGKPVSLAIDRPDDKGELERISVNVVPEQPTQFFNGFSMGDDFSVDSLGIVYPVFQIVQDVVPGGPADQGGLKSGDVITHLQLVPSAKDREEQKASAYALMNTPYKLNPELVSWPFVDDLVQHILPTTEVKLLYRRPDAGATFEDVLKLANAKGESQEAVVMPIDSNYYQDTRGLIFASFEEEPHPAESWGEAFSLGLRQTYEDGTKVIFVLKKLVTFQMSPTNLGGIGSITMVATLEASQGTGRLLLFLTFLSANLAVINFLPIPVLDGGHMMFLTWEAIFRRPMPEKWQFQMTLGGLAFVLCLFLFTNGLDVYRFVVAPMMRWLG